MAKKLQEILDDLVVAAHDADGLRENMTLEDLQVVMGNLESVHYFCMDARTIIRRRIKRAEQNVQSDK